MEKSTISSHFPQLQYVTNYQRVRCLQWLMNFQRCMHTWTVDTVAHNSPMTNESTQTKPSGWMETTTEYWLPTAKGRYRYKINFNSMCMYVHTYIYIYIYNIMYIYIYINVCIYGIYVYMYHMSIYMYIIYSKYIIYI